MNSLKSNLVVIEGKVVSDKSEMTIKVEVERQVFHKKYKKYYKSSSIYHVHDPKSLFKKGDIVKFVGCRPISKTKHSVVLYNSVEN